jgi:hypothetical protein
MQVFLGKLNFTFAEKANTSLSFATTSLQTAGLKLHKKDTTRKRMLSFFFGWFFLIP